MEKALAEHALSEKSTLDELAAAGKWDSFDSWFAWRHATPRPTESSKEKK